MTEKPLEQMGLRDLRAIARRQMPAEAWHHFNGAAETKATFYRNPRSFKDIFFGSGFFTTLPTRILPLSYSVTSFPFQPWWRRWEVLV
jgi:hypothetical protein